MPVYCIPGSYKIVGASPDGDSVRFYPDDPTFFERAGMPVRLNAHGGGQLRLDAIDALETHYTPPRSKHMWRQPQALARGAGDELLAHLGFSDVQRTEDGTVTAAVPDSTRGYILTRFADTYGRAVSFAYAGDRPEGAGEQAQAQAPDADGDEQDDAPQVAVGGLPTVHLDVPELTRSANYQLLSAGLVYPTFYSKLYVDLREALAKEADRARAAHQGIWAQDVTHHGFDLTSRDQLENELVILPKLFRRLAEFLSLDETGSASLTGFRAFLAQHDDRLFTVPAGQSTGFDTLVKVRGKHVRLTLAPEHIVFVEK
jgi:hypothetical protein